MFHLNQYYSAVYLIRLFCVKEVPYMAKPSKIFLLRNRVLPNESNFNYHIKYIYCGIYNFRNLKKLKNQVFLQVFLNFFIHTKWSIPSLLSTTARNKRNQIKVFMSVIEKLRFVVFPLHAFLLFSSGYVDLWCFRG